MAVLNFTGFDDGSLIDCMTSGGKVSAQSDVTCFGSGYSLRIQCKENETGILRLGGGSALNDPATIAGSANYYITFYFYFVTAPSMMDTDIITIYDSSSNSKLKLCMTSNRTLKLINAASTYTTLGTGSTVLEANKWYNIALRSGTGASANYALEINTISELSGTYNGTVNNGYVEFGRRQDNCRDAFEFYYDDFVVDDSAFLRNLHTKILVANAAGTNNQWTAVGNATPYLTTTQLPSDSDQYLSSPTASQISTFNVQDTASANIVGTVSAVKELVVGFQEATNNINAYMLYSGNNVTTNNAVITYRMGLGFLRTTAPGGASWTTAIVDALELGVSGAATTNVKVVTSVYGLILWTPSAYYCDMTGKLTPSGGAAVPRTTTVTDVTDVEGTSSQASGLIVEEYESVFTNTNDVTAGVDSNDSALEVAIPSTPRLITVVRKMR